MQKRLIFSILLICSLFIGCSRNKTLTQIPSEVKWQTAESLFNRGKYNRAVPYYEQLVFEKNSIYTGDAQFKLGECYFRMKKYIEAIFEYQELLRLFPDHRLAPDAQFQIGLSYARMSLSAHYTQTESDKAVDAFTLFTERYPQNPKAAEAFQYIVEMQLKSIEKTYLNGYIYYKMKDYPAAELYLNEIIALGNRNDLEKMAVFYKILIHCDRKEKDQASAAIEHLKTHFPNSKQTKNAQKRLARIDSKTWRLIYMY